MNCPSPFKYFLYLVSFLVLIITPAFIFAPSASAATCDPPLVIGKPVVPETVYTGEDFEITLKLDPSIAKPMLLQLYLSDGTDNPLNSWEIRSEGVNFDPAEMIKTGKDTLVFKFKGSDIIHPFDKYQIRLKSKVLIDTSFDLCGDLGIVKITEKKFADVGNQCKILLPDNINVKSKDFKLTYESPKADVIYGVIIGPPDKITPTGQTTYYKGTTFTLLKAALLIEGLYLGEVSPPKGTVDFLGWNITGYNAGNYRAALNAWVYKDGYYHGFTCAHKDFKVTNLPTSEITEGKTISPVVGTNKTEPLRTQSCKDAGDCSEAAGDIDQKKKCLNTAIGCIPIDLNSFLNALLVYTAGIAGGVAFLLMIGGSLQMITSQGNAEQLKKGREQFIAAISGLLFIIFSITLLQIIGADILGLPGFGR